MKIEKGIVKYKDRNDIVCTYGTCDDGTKYYFLDETDTKKFSNGNRIVSTLLIEAIDPMVKATKVGVIDDGGKVVIPCVNRSVRPVNDNVVLVEAAIPISQSVIDAVEQRNDPNSAAKLVSTPATIKDRLAAQMGTEGKYLFNDQFSEATLFDINGNNLVNNDYYSFITEANGKLYLCKNTADSEIKEYALTAEAQNTIDVSGVSVDQNVVEGALASAAVPEAVEALTEENASSSENTEVKPEEVVTPPEVPAVGEDVPPVVPEVSAEESAASPEVPVVGGDVPPVVPEAESNEPVVPAEALPVEGAAPVENTEVREGEALSSTEVAAPVEALSVEGAAPVENSEVNTAEVSTKTDTTTPVDAPAPVDGATPAEVPASTDNVQENVVEQSAETANAESQNMGITPDDLNEFANGVPNDGKVEEVSTPVESFESPVNVPTLVEEVSDKVGAPQTDEVVDEKVNENTQANDVSLPPVVKDDEANEESLADEVSLPPVVKEDDEVNEEALVDDGEDVIPFDDKVSSVQEEEFNSKLAPISSNDAFKDLSIDKKLAGLGKNDVDFDMFSKENSKHVEEDFGVYRSSSRPIESYGAEEFSIPTRTTSSKYDDIFTDVKADNISYLPENDNIMSDVARSMSELVRQNREQRSLISQYKGKIESAESQRRMLTDQYKQQAARIDALANKLRDYEAGNSRLESRNQMLEGHLHELKKINENQERELKNLRVQLEGRKDLVKALAAAKELLGNDNDDYSTYDGNDGYYRRGA